MSKVIFGMNPDPTSIPTKVEEALRKELSLPYPIPYQVEEVNMVRTSGWKVARDLGKFSLLAGAGEAIGKEVSHAAGRVIEHLAKEWIERNESTLGVVHFDLAHPRTARISISISRISGIMVCATRILYQAPLSFSIAGEIGFVKHLLYGEFTGNDPHVAMLNKNSTLITDVKYFLEEETYYNGRLPLKLPTRFSIVPDQNDAACSILSIATQAKAKWLGMSHTLDAKKFFEIVTQLEATLSDSRRLACVLSPEPQSTKDMSKPLASAMG